MSIARVRNVVREFGSDDNKILALDGVSLTLEPGEVVALTGRSGSGKSTLLKILAGLDAPTSGSVHICDDAVASHGRREQIRRGVVSLIFQDYNLVPELTAIENIRLAMSLSGCQVDDTRAMDALETVGMSGYERRFPATLSGGEQQRVAIARSLAVRAKLVLADEPTGALDEENAVAVMQAIRSACEGDRAALIATHDPVMVQLSDRVVSLAKGQLQD